MLSDLQKRKFTVAFRLYDVNNDGVLERDDFINFASRMANTFRASAPPDAAENLQSIFQAQWEQMRELADSDGDERVTLDEWLDYFALLTSMPEAGEMFINGYTDASFAMYSIVDPNGPQDAQTRERFTLWMSLGGQDAQRAGETFDRFDADGDGKISREETRALIHQWLGDDPNARGNELLGAY